MDGRKLHARQTFDRGQKLDEFSQVVVARLDAEFPQAVQEVVYFLDELTVVIDRASVVDVCTFLRDDPALVFNYMCDLSAVDMWPEMPRFEVNVHLLALKLPQGPRNGPRNGPNTQRLRVKIRLEERDAKMPTLTGVWPSAAWYERETHDLFGIAFEGHPDLRPLLLPDDAAQSPGYETPPLRRDVPVIVEEVAFSFTQERIYRHKPFAVD